MALIPTFVSVPLDSLEQSVKRMKTIALLLILVEMEARAVMESTRTPVNVLLALKERIARIRYRDVEVVLAEMVAPALTNKILTDARVQLDIPEKTVTQSSRIAIPTHVKMMGRAQATSALSRVPVFPVLLDELAKMIKRSKILLMTLMKL